MNKEEKFFMTKTELEIKAVQFFKDIGEPIIDWDDVEELEHYANTHILREFHHGYKEGGYNIDNDPDLQNRIDKFLKIVSDDMDGRYEYKAEYHETVFGLIRELGL